MLIDPRNKYLIETSERFAVWPVTCTVYAPSRKNHTSTFSGTPWYIPRFFRKCQDSFMILLVK
jgi:hypothetical protein